MRKSILIIIVCMAMLLTGCQLAQPDAGAEAKEDRMIGILVTTEPLEMMDNGYTEPVSVTLTEQDMKRLERGDYSPLELPHRKYFAELVPDTREGVDGDRWSFDHLGGWALMAPTMTDENGNVYVAAGSTDGMCDVQTHVKSHEHDTGTSEELILSGTVYHLIGGEDIIFEMNPIYQTEDGQVYAMPGTGSSFSSDIDTEGSAFTHTLTEETVLTDGNSEISCRTEAAVSIARIHRPVRVIVLQMTQDGVTLDRAEYEPGKLPETIAPLDDAAFLVVQTVKRDLDGNELVTTVLADQGDTSFTTFYAEGSICLMQMTTLEWD